ncbi:MAG: TonB-dependent receptor domain-containing protein, partial [Terriglobales bacterium]
AAVATTETVNAAAAPLLNTTDASLGNVLGRTQIAQLPIPDRNVVALLSLQAGVVYLGENMNTSQTDTRSGAVNGLRSDQSNVTLDGVNVNDENNAYAFDSVLNIPPDSVEEFRVTTADPNANAGYSAGAQVALVTKSGTNHLHGSIYEYNRDTAFSANDTFLKDSQLESHEPNKAPALIRNIYGVTLGGPILKNRLFFFINYEGRRDSQGLSEDSLVPSAAMRQGEISYLVSPGTNTSSCYQTAQSPQGTACVLNAAQLRAMDPLNIGPDAATLKVMQAYPMPNDLTVGDGLNVVGYRFAPTVRRRFNTYISRLDWHITPNGSESVFWRGQLDNDNQPGAPNFPGGPAATTELDNSKGSIVGLTSVLSPTMVNNVRWGYIRQGVDDAGVSNQPAVFLNGLTDLTPFTRSSSFIVPVNNLIDNYSWNVGNHLIEFGANLNFIRDREVSTGQSFSDAQTNVAYLAGASIANTGNPMDPPVYGYPAVATNFDAAYDSPLAAIMGFLPEGDGVYNFTRSGQALPQGTPLARDYAINDYELYGQDQWHIAPSLTLTYGLRWDYQQPPFEENGFQVTPCVLGAPGCENAGQWFENRGALAAEGKADSMAGELNFVLGGPRNQGPGFWNPDYTNFSPRLAIAWSPDFGDGWLGTILGRNHQASIRAGYSLMYDHFGMPMVNSFNQNGSFGLSSKIGNAAGSVDIADVPRFTCLTCLPPPCASLTTPGCIFGPAPTGGFPVTPSSGLFAINWGLDSAIKTPYAHVFNVSYERQIGRGSSLQFAYVGTIGRRLPMQMDLAMPTDLVDPKSKMDYFTAATMLSKLAAAGTNINNVQPIAYWQDLFPALAGQSPSTICPSCGTLNGSATATQMAYAVIASNLHNETYALFELDTPSAVNGSGLPNSNLGPYAYYADQFSSLYSWNNIGTSDYNALQITYNVQLTRTLQSQVNFTWSKSLDEESAVGREGPYEGTGGTGNDLNGGGVVINSWDPLGLRGLSDFNAFDQLNSNWVWTLPFGRGQWIGSGSHGWLNELIGGWNLSGLFTWTSGFPITVDNGFAWATNWNIEGDAELIGALPQMQTTDNVVGASGQGEGPNMFPDPAAAEAAFRQDWPGESGVRNDIVGDGIFDIDSSLSKTFPLGEGKNLEFAWQTFNVTNTVRYNVRAAQPALNAGGVFGQYNSTISTPRFMQFSLDLHF